MTDTATTQAEPQVFPHTHWSLVLAAAGQSSAESAAALETLCRAYWYPLYVCARRLGHSPEDAQDLTQGFFCSLLEKRWLATANPAKGRLRTFLITAFRRFVAKEWRRASAQRRGGGANLVPIDTVFAESRYAAEATVQSTPEEAFDRQWALMLLDLTMRRLEVEFAQGGKSADFGILKTCLTARRGEIDYDTIATRLGVGEGAARVATHRLRKRFRELYRQEIVRTLAAEGDVETELRHLGQVLART
jgi:RNA polymerase sigma factor (sigma-70 family)